MNPHVLPNAESPATDFEEMGMLLQMAETSNRTGFTLPATWGPRARAVLDKYRQALISPEKDAPIYSQTDVEALMGLALAGQAHAKTLGERTTDAIEEARTRIGASIKKEFGNE